MNKPSTRRKIVSAVQGPYPVEVVRQGRVAGVLLHAGGMMRLFDDPVTRELYAEVVGFHSESARRFLSQLHGLPWIADDLLVCDRPEDYSLEERPVREYHVRRSA